MHDDFADLLGLRRACAPGRSIASTGWIGFYLPDSPELKVASGTLQHVYVRITFAKTAKTGLWHFEPQVGSYMLITPKGTSDSALLDDVSRKQYTTTLRP